MPAWEGRLGELAWVRAAAVVAGGFMAQPQTRGLSLIRNPNPCTPTYTLNPDTPSDDDEIQAVAAYVFDQAEGNKW
jgi:hypothetical protein